MPIVNRRLVEAFAAHWAGHVSEDVVPALEEVLVDVVAIGETKWPALALERGDFVRFLAERTAAGEPVEELRRLRARAADLFLACACLRRTPGALAAFDAAYLAGCEMYLRGIDTAPEFTQEVAQMVREKLFVGEPERSPRIAEYVGRGSLAGWVRVTLVRTALNLRRARTVRLQARDDDMDAAVDGDAALAFAKANYHAPFQAAVRAAVSALSAQQRTVMRFHFVDGLNIDKIGQLYKVHRSTIARWLADTRDALRTSIRSELHRRLGVSGSECESLVNALYSQLTLSLGSLLDAPPRPLAP